MFHSSTTALQRISEFLNLQLIRLCLSGLCSMFIGLHWNSSWSVLACISYVCLISISYMYLCIYVGRHWRQWQHPTVYQSGCRCPYVLSCSSCWSPPFASLFGLAVEYAYKPFRQGLWQALCNAHWNQVSHETGEITTASLFAGKHIGRNEKYTLNILEHWIQWRDGQYGEWWSHGFLWQREHGFSSPCAGRSIFHKNSSLIKKSSSWIMVQQVVTWYSKPVIFNTPQAHEYWLRLVHADTVVNYLPTSPMLRVSCAQAPWWRFVGNLGISMHWTDWILSDNRHAFLRQVGNWEYRREKLSARIQRKRPRNYCIICFCFWAWRLDLLLKTSQATSLIAGRYYGICVDMDGAVLFLVLPAHPAIAVIVYI